MDKTLNGVFEYRSELQENVIEKCIELINDDKHFENYIDSILFSTNSLYNGANYSKIYGNMTSRKSESLQSTNEVSLELIRTMETDEGSVSEYKTLNSLIVEDYSDSVIQDMLIGQCSCKLKEYTGKIILKERLFLPILVRNAYMNDRRAIYKLKALTTKYVELGNILRDLLECGYDIRKIFSNKGDD